MLHYFFFLLTLLFFSCQKNSVNLDSSIGKLFSEKDLSSVKIDFSEIQKVDTTNQWLYGVKIYQVVNGTDSCYAHGLFSDIDKIHFIPEFDKKYYFQATAINKGTGLGLYNSLDSISGYYQYFTPLEAVLDNTFHYSCFEKENWYFDPASNYARVFEFSESKTSTFSLMPELIRYYGESDTVNISKKTKIITLDLWNISYGLDIKVEGMQDGDVAYIEIFGYEKHKGLRNHIVISYPTIEVKHYYEFGDGPEINRNYLKKVIKPEIPRYEQSVSINARIVHKDGSPGQIAPKSVIVQRNETSIVNLKVEQP